MKREYNVGRYKELELCVCLEDYPKERVEETETEYRLRLDLEMWRPEVELNTHKYRQTQVKLSKYNKGVKEVTEKESLWYWLHREITPTIRRTYRDYYMHKVYHLELEGECWRKVKKDSWVELKKGISYMLYRSSIKLEDELLDYYYIVLSIPKYKITGENKELAKKSIKGKLLGLDLSPSGQISYGTLLSKYTEEGEVTLPELVSGIDRESIDNGLSKEISKVKVSGNLKEGKVKISDSMYMLSKRSKLKESEVELEELDLEKKDIASILKVRDRSVMLRVNSLKIEGVDIEELLKGDERYTYIEKADNKTESYKTKEKVEIIRLKEEYDPRKWRKTDKHKKIYGLDVEKDSDMYVIVLETDKDLEGKLKLSRTYLETQHKNRREESEIEEILKVLKESKCKGRRVSRRVIKVGEKTYMLYREK